MRAVAVSIVIASHMGLGQIVPGGLGVTIFFFLSGYLITSLLVVEAANTGTVSLKAFYIRRTLRIFPPLYITLAVGWLLIAFGVLSKKVDFGSLLTQALFLSNYDRLWDGHGGGVPAPLWSLAVEEHFYLVFPLVFLVFLMRKTPYKAAVICGIACIPPLVFRIIPMVMGVDYSLNYFFTHTRIDSILFGCCLALWRNPVLDAEKPFRPGLLGFAFGTILVCGATLVRSDMFAESFRYTIQGIGLYFVFAYILSPGAITSPVLNSSPLQIIGRFSYTLYLVHELVNAVLKSTMPDVAFPIRAVIALAVSFAYSWAMYAAVEKPLAAVRRNLHKEAEKKALAANAKPEVAPDGAGLESAAPGQAL